MFSLFGCEAPEGQRELSQIFSHLLMEKAKFNIAEHFALALNGTIMQRHVLSYCKPIVARYIC